MVSGMKYEPGFGERAVLLYLERRAEHQEESLASTVRQVASILGMSGHAAWLDARGRG